MSTNEEIADRFSRASAAVARAELALEAAQAEMAAARAALFQMIARAPLPPGPLPALAGGRIQEGSARHQVLSAMLAEPEKAWDADMLVARTNLPDSRVRSVVSKLFEAKRIVRIAKGMYRAASSTPE